jgi:membrane associated rhomboid family serine protease
MDKTESIRSESKLFWKLLFHLISTPVTLLQVMSGKKQAGELFKPFYELLAFLFEPKFTILMILANCGLYVWCLYQSPAALSELINYPSNLFGPKAYTLITSGFVHASFIHLMGNMLALFIFGRIVERKLGFFKAALVYFGALFISNVFSSLIHLFILGNNIGGIGASGAIMGLAATAMLIDPLYLTFELLIPLPVMVVAWLTIYADITGVLNPVEDGIGHFAHLGGFISIALLMFLLDSHDRQDLKRGLMINMISVLIAAIFVYMFGVPALPF